MMKVEIWSDFICPKSYLGRQRFLEAVDQFPYRKHVVIESKSYLLNRHGNRKQIENYLNHATSSDNDQYARALRIKNDTLNQPNTLTAHRLVHFAKTKAKDLQFVDKIFHAHFVEQKLIDDSKTLLSIAHNCGFSFEEVESILMTSKYRRQVDIDQDEADQMGVAELPFIVINEMYAVLGTYSVMEFLNILTDIWEEIKDQPRYKLCKTKAQTSFCTGDHCE